ncbi:hypothetical protein [Latilactobacillus fuchuensis]|uniref:hypothetical protein n=1 Tax=Latilactobacillus fuchuensis TaxID=164393 RepID=UPI0039B0E780
MQNFNHKNESKKNQEPIQPSQKAPQNNGNLWDKVVNWGVMLATKYGKTFEIIIWALMVIGIIFLPILSVAMTFFAYCYSKINPNRGHIMMAVALIGGIVAWIIGARMSDNAANDGVVWYYWSE